MGESFQIIFCDPQETNKELCGRQTGKTSQLACLAVLDLMCILYDRYTGHCCAGHYLAAVRFPPCNAAVCCVPFVSVCVAHRSGIHQSRVRPLFHHNKQSKVSRSSSLIGPLAVHPSHPSHVQSIQVDSSHVWNH
jgi:hypothetical protein